MITAERFAEIVENAVSEGIIEEKVKLILNDQVKFNTPRNSIDDARYYGIIGNVAWLWFVSRIKESENGQD